MEQDQKGNSNILKFPGKRKEAEPVQQNAPAAAKPARAKRSSKSNKTVLAAILSVMLGTGAFNRIAFNAPSGSIDIASNDTQGRAIASVERLSWERDSKWEKDLAEQLASSRVRVPAAFGVGRSATIEEKLRWGVLEEKYAIGYNDAHIQIRSILFEDQMSEPAVVSDRSRFLNEYGMLFDASYASAKLKSVEANAQNTIESYLLIGQDSQPKGEVRIELDQKSRLISLKVEPVKI